MLCSVGTQGSITLAGLGESTFHRLVFEERAGRRVVVVSLGMPLLHDLDFQGLSQGASQAVAGPLTGF